MTVHELPCSSRICMDGLHCGACGGMGDVRVRTAAEVVCLWTKEC